MEVDIFETIVVALFWKQIELWNWKLLAVKLSLEKGCDWLVGDQQSLIIYSYHTVLEYIKTVNGLKSC